MPGICGYYKHHPSSGTSIITRFGVTATVDKEIKFSNNLYIRQYIIPKFQNDKLFVETDDIFISTDGWFSIAEDIYAEYGNLSKSELLPVMYLKEGICFINRLRGNFSGIIYDKKRNLLHVFTDHLGSKRVFYYYNEDRKDFLFASDLKVLTEIMQASNYPTIVDETGAYCLLSMGYMLENITLCRDAFRLEPGTILTFSIPDGSMTKKQYFKLTATPEDNRSEDEIIQKLDTIFTQAVKRAWDIDNEYGYKHIATISGGLDSRMNLVKAHMNGYEDICTFTYCESGYFDQTISQKIASDLRCEHLFYALDNGNFLKNIVSPVKANDGLILYSGAAATMACCSRINFENYGLIHTGIEGETLKGVYLLSENHSENYHDLLIKHAYAPVLFERINHNLISSLDSKYDSDEICLFYNHGVNGSNNGHYMMQNYSEYASPFMDVDVVDYIMKIPPKYKYKSSLYLKWVNKTTPIAAKYMWEATLSKINHPKIVSFVKRGMRYVRSKYLKQRLTSMNPFEYWFIHNKSLQDYFDSNYQKNITSLNNYDGLRKSADELYESGTTREKTQVLTLCQAVNWLGLK